MPAKIFGESPSSEKSGCSSKIKIASAQELLVAFTIGISGILFGGGGGGRFVTGSIASDS